MESKVKVLGHALHQMLVVFPLGLLTVAVIFDVIYLVGHTPIWTQSAYYMIAAGLIGGLAAAVPGWVDWWAIPRGTRAKRVGLLHGVGNVLVLVLFALSWLLRRSAPPAPPVEAIIAGKKRKIDIGEINGEIFVHHVTLGLHPQIVADRERERYRSRLGKKFAWLKAWWKLLHRAPRMRLQLAVDSERVKLKTSSLIIANNRFVERLGGLPYSEMPDSGKLAVYAAQTRDWKELLAMSAEATFGKWESNSKLDFLEGCEIAVHAQRQRLRASIDGELIYLRTPLRAKMRASSLWVLCPASAEAEPKKSSAAAAKSRSPRRRS